VLGFALELPRTLSLVERVQISPLASAASLVFPSSPPSILARRFRLVVRGSEALKKSGPVNAQFLCSPKSGVLPIPLTSSRNRTAKARSPLALCAPPPRATRVLPERFARPTNTTSVKTQHFLWGVCLGWLVVFFVGVRTSLCGFEVGSRKQGGWVRIRPAFFLPCLSERYFQ
jgi:hypothetical protein